MNQYLKCLLAVVVGAGSWLAVAGTAEAFENRAAWIRYLQDQARAEQGMDRDQVRQLRLASLQAGTARSAAKRMDPQFLPTVVPFSGYAPGTIVIDTSEKFLYLVEPGGQARRYGVGVGRPGFQWAGTNRITRKAEWPGWTPPPQMRKRQPELPAFMPGGPDNPLGARALYLGSTLYRIHGSNAPWTIGHAVSSGCIRMRNEDVIDLYERVGVGTRVIVKH